jgi:predicted metal-dependent hydrolase
VPQPPISAASLLALEEGCRLFDAGRFFEAHEVWEGAWRVEVGRVRRLLQGLIQVAAGFHKGLVQARPAGMLKLLASGLDRLGAAGELGLDELELERFEAEVTGWREAARCWAGGGARPELPIPQLLRPHSLVSR